MRYAIQVFDKNIPEIREYNISKLLGEEYRPTKYSYFIGNNNKNAKFLNWYDNREYINTWDTKEEAEQFYNWLMDRAEKNYNTTKDPFYNVRKTKGDWKKFLFLIVKIYD